MPTENKSTADYRPYPKGPNFLGIVIAFAVAILLILGAAYLFLTDAGKHLLRKANPQASLQVPAGPSEHIRPGLDLRTALLSL